MNIRRILRVGVVASLIAGVVVYIGLFMGTLISGLLVTRVDDMLIPLFSWTSFFQRPFYAGILLVAGFLMGIYLAVKTERKPKG